MNELAKWAPSEKYELDADDALGNHAFMVIKTTPAGERWTNQSGGYSCKHPVVVGVHAQRVPPMPEVRNVARLLMAYFTGPRHHGWCDANDNGHEFDLRDADVVDAALIALDLDDWAVDRGRLADCMEAWVWLASSNGMDNGVLVWENSD